jgi:hypothetical protein
MQDIRDAWAQMLLQTATEQVEAAGGGITGQGFGAKC